MFKRYQYEFTEQALQINIQGLVWSTPEQIWDVASCDLCGVKIVGEWLPLYYDAILCGRCLRQLLVTGDVPSDFKSWEDIIKEVLETKQCTLLCDEARQRYKVYKLKLRAKGGYVEEPTLKKYCFWCLLGHRLQGLPDKGPRQKPIRRAGTKGRSPPCRAAIKGYSWRKRRHWLIQYRDLMNCAK